MSKAVAGGVAQALRRLALRYPNAEEGIACEGTPLERRTVKAGKKAFLFLGVADMMVKLRESLAAAARLAVKEPERYQVGANGWVTASLGDDAPPLDLLEKWVDESYRVVVNKGVDLGPQGRPPRTRRKSTIAR